MHLTSTSTTAYILEANKKYTFDISKPQKKAEVAREMGIDRKTFSRLINTGILYELLTIEANYKKSQSYLYPKQLKILDKRLGGLSDDTIELQN